MTRLALLASCIRLAKQFIQAARTRLVWTIVTRAVFWPHPPIILLTLGASRDVLGAIFQQQILQRGKHHGGLFVHVWSIA
jgi:hypothetical protein